MAPHGVYRAAGEDDWIAIACRDDADWRALCGLLGPGLDPEADLAARRAEHGRDRRRDCGLDSRSNEIRSRGRIADGGRARRPRLHDPGDGSGSASAGARLLRAPRSGTPMPGNPIKMQGITPDDWTPCPRLGADNRGVLRDWLGYDDERIDQLERDSVLADVPPA